MHHQAIPPRTGEEVIAAVDGKNPPRISLVRAKWWGEGLVGQYGDAVDRFDPIPEDTAQLLMPNPVDPARMDLS